MIVLLQRVLDARVSVEGKVIGEIDQGFLAFVCAQPSDTPAIVQKLAAKTAKLRVFADDAGKMNRSVLDVNASVLVVSQFTLCADTMSGNRPSFSGAASPELGHACYEGYIESLRQMGVPVAQGEFGADMQVSLTNDGPATFWLKL